MKNKKTTIVDKSLANAVKKGEIKMGDLSKRNKEKIKKILKNKSDEELEKSSKNKYKFSKRKIKHISKNKNESMENNKKEEHDFKNIIKKIEDWDDEVQGGLAKDKKPTDYDLDDLSKGSEIQMEHTDDPKKAIDIAMDHLEEFDDYYDDEKGLPAMERELENDDNDYEDDDYEDDDDDYEDDDYEDDDDDKVKENSSYIISFSEFNKINENKEPKEPKMYPRENKFKRVVEYKDEIEQSLIEHNFEKIDSDGNFIVFDIMNKTFELVDKEPDDIRPVTESEFDHLMDNL